MKIYSSRIHNYLDGSYNLGEIALHEKMTRPQILTTIEHFQSIIFSALHPDPNPILQI